MGRACKCRQCQSSLTTESAIKKLINGKPAYFCNEEHYRAYVEKLEEESRQKEKKKQSKNRVYQLVCEVLGYKDIVNTALYKEWQVWNKVATDDVIAQYLEENKNYLGSVISRLDDIVYNRIRYLSTILKNKLGDYKPNVKEAKQNCISAVQEEHYETKFKLKQRAALLDFEEDCCE